MQLLPINRTGICSVGLTLFSVLLLLTFFAFMALGLVTFDSGHWWDITIALAGPAEIAAFILSIASIRRKEERSVLVFISFALGLCAVLFLFLHSLFIHD